MTRKPFNTYGNVIRVPLMKQQRQMVEFADEHKRYVGLFGDYGVGKTLAALAIIANLRMRKVLIVSTKLAIETTWPTEIRKWTTLRYFLLEGSRKAKLKLLQRGLQSQIRDAMLYNSMQNACAKTMLFIINFDGIKSIAPELADVQFDAIFVDESTKIRYVKTARTKYLWALGVTAKRRYIMTGFPVSEGIHELYAQIKFLDNGRAFGNSYWSFLHHYFVRQGPHLVPTKSSVKKIIEAISPFCIRITNKDLALPEKVRKTIEVKKTKQQEKLFQELHDLFSIELGNVKIDVQYIFTLIAKALQICDGFVMDKDRNVEIVDTNKDEALLETLEEIDVRKHKVVIWANHVFTIKKLEVILNNIYKKKGIKILTLYGKTVDTNLVVNTFQHVPRANLLITSMKKAAESVTLTAAKYALYYGHQWSYNVRDNSEARTCRKGSEIHDHITYADFVTKGTVERTVLSSTLRKGNLVASLKEQFLDMGIDKTE